jgi:MFS family permease
MDGPHKQFRHFSASNYHIHEKVVSMEITERPEDISSPPSSSNLRPITFFDQININMYWIACQFHWQALQAIVIPSMVAHLLDPNFKAINLSIVVTLGTIVAFVVNPLVGAISDYATFRMGRRRPFMILGTILNVIVLVIFAFSPSWFPPGLLLLTFTILFLLLEFTNNLANAPWSAIIADKVPTHQRGLCSGFNGLFNLLGTAIGAIVAGALLGGDMPMPAYRNAIVQIFLLIAVVQIVFAAYTVLTVKETPLPEEQHQVFHLRAFVKKFFFHPAQYPDLSWVLLARFLVMMGIWSVFYFLVYFFQDVLGGPGIKTILLNTPFTGEEFNGVLFQPVLLLASLPTSLIAGWASDRWGRKGLVYLSGAMMALVCLIFILFPNQYIALIAGAFFGIGYGAYSSVDWALTADVLPPTNEAGKFLGIWTAMGILPQVIGIIIGGILLQSLQGLPHHIGYTILFLLTVFYCASGTIIIYKVRGVK